MSSVHSHSSSDSAATEEKPGGRGLTLLFAELQGLHYIPNYSPLAQGKTLNSIGPASSSVLHASRSCLLAGLL